MKGKPPIELLKKLRVHFVNQAEIAGEERGFARTINEREAVMERQKTALRYVSDIDATLRDWA